MPSALTYPGVYIEEIPSGVRTIAAVATSNAAFVGRAARGPTGDSALPTESSAIVINGFQDYERIFGGLSLLSPMSYAVRDFFQNGGAEAIIVRLYKQDGTNPKTARLTVGGLQLDAANEGSWGNNLQAKITPVSADTFNLTVVDSVPGGATETHLNLTVKEGKRRIDRVLMAESGLVRYAGPALDPAHLPAVPTAVTNDIRQDLQQKQQALDDANTALAKAQADLAAAQTAQETAAATAAVTAATAAVTAATTARDTAQTAVTAGTATAKDSAPLGTVDYIPSNGLAQKKGLFALEQTDLFNLLCIPADDRASDTPSDVYQAALAYCVARRAMLIVDSPSAWNTTNGAQDLISNPLSKLSDLNIAGDPARNAAIYYPRIKQPDPLRDGQIDTFVPCGAIAGIMARTDLSRGVWKAPAGIDAAISGVSGLAVSLTDKENGNLNVAGINCLRSFPAYGRVVWGSRTMRGGDQSADEYKYVPVRRTALMIEEALYRGTQWVVFEPNADPLWAQVRLNIGAYLQGLFRQGAFQGREPRDAYFVRCDNQTTTQTDINLGIVNIVVGVALLRPAEFVVIKIQQIAGQTQ